MFEGLSTRLQAIAGRLRGQARLTPADLDDALRDVRLALLEADVHFRVAAEFVARVRERALGSEVLSGVQPGHQVVKLVHDELVAVLGGGATDLDLAADMAVVMLVGLQGSGKTTSAVKLGVRLQRQGRRVMLVAADVYRPAATEQLVHLARGAGLEVYSGTLGSRPAEIVDDGVAEAGRRGLDTVVVDTAGRLHLDQPMMEEVGALSRALEPAAILLVVDAMTGQDAVRVAQGFATVLPLTGLVLTKMDGDARGGAALSIRSLTGLPVLFMGTGERSDALDAFHPDRLAGRILGMGDIVSLVERAQEHLEQAEADGLAANVLAARFGLDDFRDQLRQVRRLGPIGEVLAMVSGAGSLASAAQAAVDDGQLKQIEAIIDSMTPTERRQPEIIKAGRRRRIAAGSGTQVADVNRLLRQFHEIQRLLRHVGSRSQRGAPRSPLGR